MSNIKPIPFPPQGGKKGWILARKNGLEYVEWIPQPLIYDPASEALLYDAGNGRYAEIEISAAPSPAFTYIQSVAAATWTINHNLGFKPTVELFNSGSLVIDAHVLHTSDQQTIVQFTAPIAGFARLN